MTYIIEEKIIESEDGKENKYLVLSKTAMVNVKDANTDRGYGVQEIKKQSIWFPPDDKDIIIDILQKQI